MTPETLATLHKVANNRQDQAAWEAAETWLRGVLSNVPPNSTWTTAQLYDAAGVCTDKDSKDWRIVKQALWRLRDSGKIADCWKPDTTRRHFGKNLIAWHRPRVTEEQF